MFSEIRKRLLNTIPNLEELKNKFFQDSFSEEIWRDNYCVNDKDILDTFIRVSFTIFEDDHNKAEELLIKLLERKISFGGRVIANVGTQFKSTAYFNCYGIQRTKKPYDSLEGIYSDLTYFAKILKTEGGCGGNFNHIRPRGTFIRGIGASTPGVIEYLKLFSNSAYLITQGNSGELFQYNEDYSLKTKIRKGAMLCALDVRHPDIFEYIICKQKPNNGLEMFNMSIIIPNEFMKAVQFDKDWELWFPDIHFEKYDEEWDGDFDKWLEKGYPKVTYKIVKAKEIWNLIMDSMYNRGEPGLLFLDNANEYNNLLPLGMKYVSTNPCFVGETIVAVADGRNGVTIKQLAEENKEFPVYSSYHNSRSINNWKAEIKKARAFKTGRRKVIEIKLSNGSSFKCTPDHLLALPNGEYIEAKNSLNKQLVKFYTYTNINVNAYYRMINTKTNGYSKQYRMIYEYYNGQYNSKIYDIDHIDNNSYNDKIDNLQLLERSKHIEKSKKFGKDNSVFKQNELHFKLSQKRKNFQANAKKYKWSNEKLNNILNEFDNSEEGLLLKKLREENEKNKTYECKFDKDVFVVDIIDNNEYEDVYDLTVEDNHNFYIITKTNDDNYLNCSGVLVHNCGEITMISDSYTIGDDQLMGDICNLGHLNLVSFYEYNNKTKEYEFNWNEFKHCSYILVESLDILIDKSPYPFKELENSAKYKRKLGCGILGYGSLLMMMGYSYGSQLANKFTIRFLSQYLNNLYSASALLAKEKGSFKLYNSEVYEKGGYINIGYLTNETKELIRKYGLRNSALSTTAPTGNTGIFMSLVSGGVEPVFSLEYNRWANISHKHEEELKGEYDYPKFWLNELHETKDFKWTKQGDVDVLMSTDGNYLIDDIRGLVKKVKCMDYGYKWCKENLSDDEFEMRQKTDVFKTALELDVERHLEPFIIFSKIIDQTISKTINVPNDYDKTSFENIFFRFWNEGGKGITVYRDGSMTAVLTTDNSEDNQDNKEDKILETENIKIKDIDLNIDDLIDYLTSIDYNDFKQVSKLNKEKLFNFLSTVGYPVFYKKDLLDVEDGKRYRVVWKGIKIYINVAHDEFGNPVELFAQLPQEAGFNGEEIFKPELFLERLSYWHTICRLISLSLRYNVPLDDIRKQLQKSSYNITHLPNILLRILYKYPLKLEEDSDDEETIELENDLINKPIKDNKDKCPTCGSKLIRIEGCLKCIDCGFSRC